MNGTSLPNATHATRRAACRIETVRVGESVHVTLRGRHAHRTNGYTGRVVDADCRAIRLDLEAERFDWHWQARGGHVAAPCGRVEAIRAGAAS